MFFTDSEGSPSGTGVQPPATVPSGQMPPFPIYVIPYPLPIVPSPASCPCYLLKPGQNDTTQGQPGQAPPATAPPQNQHQNQPQYAPYGIIGFVPVVFVPYCPGNGNGMNNAQQNFPNAVPVQYNCAQCQANRDIYQYLGRLNGGRSADKDYLKDLKEIKSLNELDDLLRNQIKPLEKSIRTIAAHPRLLNETNEKKDVNKNEKKDEIKNENKKKESKNENKNLTKTSLAVKKN